eukprot:232665_1
MLSVVKIAKSFTPRFTRYLSTTKTINIKDIPEANASSHDLIFKTIDPWLQIVKDNKNNEYEMIKWNIGESYSICPFNNDAIKEIYRLETNGTVKPSAPPNVIKLLGENALVFLSLKRHSPIRKKLNPFFTLESMRHRHELMANIVNNLLSTMYEKTITNGDSGVHLYSETKLAAFELGLRAVFGDLLSEEESNSLFENLEIWYAGWTDMKIENENNPDTLFGKAMIAKHNFEELIEKIWKKGIEEYNSNNLDTNSTIYGLIHSKVLAEDEIGNVMLTIVFASYETAASSVCNLVYNMYKYKDEKERLRERIKDLNINNFDDIMNNPYLDSFIKESLRILPTVAILNKGITKDCVFNGVKVEQNNFLTIPFSVMSYNENVYDKPNIFDGERFITNPPKRNAFLPFSMGTHKCLGEHLAQMELKYITAALVQQCDIIYVDETRLDSSPSYVKYVDVYGKFAML